MGENQCYHCGAITPCKSGLHGQQYVEMQALYWTSKAEDFKPAGNEEQ